MKKTKSAAVLGLSLACGMAAFAGQPASAAALQTSPDPAGTFATLSTTGPIDPGNAFFQSLGTNGRTCGTCHVPGNAFGLSAANAAARFSQTRGQDPLFAPVDGANCPTAQRGDAAAHSLIIGNGLIRIALPVPANDEFTNSVVHDPYGCALTLDPGTGQLMVSVYRRPLPATNLGFLSAVMIDGRETIAPLNDSSTFSANLVTDLTQQALDATTGHAQAAQPPTAQQLAQMVGFELGLFSAQSRDWIAGSLSNAGAQGGPTPLSNQPYYPGINDSLGGDPTGAAFDPAAMTVFTAWSNLPVAGTPLGAIRNAARQAIAAGEQIFDSAPLMITDVRGLNDNPALGSPTTIIGHCTTCHDAPNVGDHSVSLPIDIGTSHAPIAGLESDPNIAAALAALSVPDLPVYLISGCPDPSNPGQLATLYTSDPGRALITGKCSDVGRIKGLILRGLAARAPYFHNGAAATLPQVVSFYNKRFQMGLTAVQQLELAAFLASL
ncbi:MAG: hypothetical protein ACREUG_13390 [Steroidobacteraceae bacterium]